LAFDGIALMNITEELNDKIINATINKIYQPEKDEINIFLRAEKINYKLLITSNPNYPRLHLSEENKDNPGEAPLFCMILRKYLLNGRIVKIIQHNFDRIAELHIQSRNDFGDLSMKKIVVEIMGRHSNIILVDENDVIIDSIKRVGFDKSSVRPVLPKSPFYFPPTMDKLNPNEVSKDEFLNVFLNDEESKEKNVQKKLVQSFFGLSPIVAQELCFRSDIKLDEINITADRLNLLYENLIKILKNEPFTYKILSINKNEFFDFSFIELKMFDNIEKEENIFDSPSELIEDYYKRKDLVFRGKQKSSDLRKVIENAIKRCEKKDKIYQKTFGDIEDRNYLKLCGELITANIYAIEKGAKEFSCVNFYDENSSSITIRLDKDLTPSENAQKYFKKYNKQKRTSDALVSQIEENNLELKYLYSVLASLDTSLTEENINEIRDELYNEGYVKKRKTKKQNRNKNKVKKTKMLCYLSPNGFKIYVGKNNIQNEELTLKFADKGDIWLHAKDIPGSHVIIRTEGNEPENEDLLFAANLAGYYSSEKNNSNISIDYTRKKYVKKINGGKTGMVQYTNHKTIFVTPDEKIITELESEN